MTNPQGTPIWYEFMTADPAAATRFYEAVVGWRIDPQSISPEADYRLIQTGAGAAGGMLALTGDMTAAGATPGWLLYVGVEDVDAKAEQARALGGGVLVPPTDIPGTGRFAFLTDPQGVPFYIMRGASDQASTAFSPETPGHGSWNELWSSDAAAALSFYTTLFGWENRETMDMGPMGGYHFLDVGEQRIGALMQVTGQAPRWNVYFHVADVDAAIVRLTGAGGAVTMGPHDVPGGSRVVVATDPEGALFALVAPGRSGEQAA